MTEETTPEPAPIVEDAEAKARSEKSAADGAKRLPAEQWAEIRTHWEYGTKTCVQLAKMYGVSPSAITSHLSRHKTVWKSKEDLIKKEAEIKIVGAAVAAEDPLAVAWEAKRRPRAAQTRDIANNQLTVLSIMQNDLIKSVKDGGRSFADAKGDFAGLKFAIWNSERIFQARLELLEVKKDIDQSKMPVLIFRDLTQEEIAAKAAGSGDEEGEFDVSTPEPVVEPIDEEDVVEEGVPSLP